jgi:hypothetical protein
MALDYSKLSEDELEALANDDYSKLSDATLKALSEDTVPQGTGMPPAPGEYATTQTTIAATRPVTQFVATQAGDALKLAKIAGEVTPKIMGEFIGSPIQSAKNLASAYIEGHPYAGKVLDTPLKAVPGAAARGLLSAAVAPENLFTLPYTMAAYEQEKIRANPNAPGLESNPYAQTVRGEYPTQAAAGAANRRQAVANMPTGYQLNPQEAANLLASGDRRTIDMYGGAQRLAQTAGAQAAVPAAPSWIDRAMEMSRKYRPQ